MDQVVRAGLVGHQIGLAAARPRTARQLRQHIGRIAEQADGNRLAARTMRFDQGQRIVQIARLLVEVARAQAKINARLLAFDDQRAGAREARRQRLRAAHAAEPRAQDPAPRPRTAIVLASGLGKRLVGTLHNALAADVDPAACRHLAVHEQAFTVQFIEMLPVGPGRHQVGVGQQHTRSARVRLEYPHRLAGLDEQCLVGFQCLERGKDLVIAGPVARGAANPAVDHQRLRVLGHLRIEVVLNHPVGSLGQPILAIQLAAARRAHDA